MKTLELDGRSAEIGRWLDASLEQFGERQRGRVPTTVGLYSCPLYGWVMLCIDCGDAEGNEPDNCPDFEFVD